MGEKYRAASEDFVLEGEKWSSVRTVKGTNLWWRHNSVRASLKMQVLLGAPGLQWWSKEGRPGSWALNGDWCAREQRPVCVVHSYRGCTATQTAEKENGSSNRTMSEHTVQHSFLPLSTPKKCLQWSHVYQNWTTKQQKKVAWSHESLFLLEYLHLVDCQVWPSLTWGREGTRCAMKSRQCDA